MKSESITLPTENKVSGVENENVRILEEALRRLGPNGENWLCGKSNPSPGMTYRHAGKSCVIGMLAEVTRRTPDQAAERWCDEGPLLRAARTLGRICPINLNDNAESFSEVRTMFEKAIELAKGEA